MGSAYRTISGLDNSQKGRLQLQPATSLVETYASPPQVGRLMSLGGYLYLFMENGTVRRTANGTTWSNVTYDNATHGAITAVDADASHFLIGTSTGNVFWAPAGATLTPVDVVAASAQRIDSIRAWRGHAFIGRRDNFFTVRIYSEAHSMNGVKYNAVVKGIPTSMAVWSQAVMVGFQTGRGTIIMAADLNQIVDVYDLFGDFQIESMDTWGSYLMYGGGRPSSDGAVYTFREILSERFLGATASVYALLPSTEYLLVGRNDIGGLWWVNRTGAGPICEYASTASKVRSIAHFGADLYYTIDAVGVIRAETGTYKTSGTLDTGWFYGGLREITKNQADVVVQLETALVTGQTVSISVRKEGESGFTAVGSLGVGDLTKTLSIPASHQQAKWLEMRITLTSGGTNTPVVRSVITRYYPIPIQKRGWGFTVRAESGIEFGDGKKETRSPETIISDLLALQTVGQIDFASMLEPTSRKVYVTDAQLVTQLMGKSRPAPTENEEGYVAVNVVEV